MVHLPSGSPKPQPITDGDNQGASGECKPCWCERDFGLYSIPLLAFCSLGSGTAELHGRVRPRSASVPPVLQARSPILALTAAHLPRVLPGRVTKPRFETELTAGASQCGPGG